MAVLKLILLLWIIMMLFLKVTPEPQSGSSFWKPRVDLEHKSTTESSVVTKTKTIVKRKLPYKILKESFSRGVIVTTIAVSQASYDSALFPVNNPKTAYFYTQWYRWAKRFFSLIPFWASGNNGHVCNIHKVWQRRWCYVDDWVPKWMRKMIFWVDKKDWERERKLSKQFKLIEDTFLFYEGFLHPGIVDEYAK